MLKRSQDSETGSIHKQLWRSSAACFAESENFTYFRCNIWKNWDYEHSMPNKTCIKFAMMQSWVIPHHRAAVIDYSYCTFWMQIVAPRWRISLFDASKRWEACAQTLWLVCTGTTSYEPSSSTAQVCRTPMQAHLSAYEHIGSWKCQYVVYRWLDTLVLIDLLAIRMVSYEMLLHEL